MSCDAWKWISASGCDKIRPGDNCFVSWQLLQLQNLTLLDLQNKVCHPGSLCISPSKDFNVMSVPTMSFHLQSPELWCSSAHSVLGLLSNHMSSVEVQVMWRRALFAYQDYVITPILLLLASSHEISMRTCVLSNYPGHAWGGDSTQEHRCEDSPSDTGSLQKPFSTLQLLEYVPLSFPQNVAHLLLLFSSLWFCLVSHTKPSLKLMLFLFPGLKPQTLLFSAVSLACNTSVSFFPFSFFKRHFKLHK